MQLDLPYHTVHYTGLRPDQIWFANDFGVFSSIEDVYKFLHRLEQVARNAGKPYEYNTVIPVMRDNSAHVIAYADEYLAAHSSGENSIAHGTLFVTGVGQPLNAGAILAFQWWNAVLEATGRLRRDSIIAPHYQMPGASTACPGTQIIGSLPNLRAPYVSPAVTPAPPTINNPPIEGDPIMYIVKPGPEIQHKTDVHFAIHEVSGIVRHAQGPDTEGVTDIRECHGVAHFNGYVRAANKMSGADLKFIS
jgi:hypothetical protein